MKIQLSLSLIFIPLAIFPGTTSSQAANPDHVRQLLQTSDCQGCDLSQANFTGFDLVGANLRGANLSQANLLQTNLARADLEQADLSGAILTGTNFTGANLRHADLSDVVTADICMGIDEESSLEPEDCVFLSLFTRLGNDLCDPGYRLEEFQTGADLEIFEQLCDSQNPLTLFLHYFLLNSFDDWGNLSFGRAVFFGADLEYATLINAQLKGADLRYALLKGADLTQTDLTYALLLDAEIEGVVGADFTAGFVTRSDVREVWATQFFTQEQQLSGQAEARQYIGSLNRAQQAYYLETGTFTEDHEVLGLGIAVETDIYRYGIQMGADRQAVTHTATAKLENFPSFAGIVSLLETDEGWITFPMMCKTEEPSFIPPQLLETSLEQRERAECPPGAESPYPSERY
jgi:uncharacterized protein YjbI with pentapeptide repeats